MRKPASSDRVGIRTIRAGKTRYTAVAGVAPPREGIRDKLKRDNSLDYTVEQITVGCGAKQVVFNGLFASLDPGDEVVISSLCWVSYPDTVRLAGGKPVMVECSENEDFKLSAEALEATITPSLNPTGSVYRACDLLALAEVLRGHPHVWKRRVPIVVVPTAYPEMNAERIMSLKKIKMVIYGNHAIRAAVTAMKDVFARIRPTEASTMSTGTLSQLRRFSDCRKWISSRSRKSSSCADTVGRSANLKVCYRTPVRYAQWPNIFLSPARTKQSP